MSRHSSSSDSGPGRCAVPKLQTHHFTGQRKTPETQRPTCTGFDKVEEHENDRERTNDISQKSIAENGSH